jgi:hypothetical protein
MIYIFKSFVLKEYKKRMFLYYLPLKKSYDIVNYYLIELGDTAKDQDVISITLHLPPEKGFLIGEITGKLLYYK